MLTSHFAEDAQDQLITNERNDSTVRESSVKVFVCCFCVKCLVMLHRRWITVNVPEGSLKVIRGQRPPSKAERTECKSSVVPQNPRQPQGPSHRSSLRPFTDPITKISAAGERVLKLEIALAAIEGIEGSEVGVITSPSQSTNRSEIANNVWSELERIWRLSTRSEPRSKPTLMKGQKNSNLESFCRKINF